MGKHNPIVSKRQETAAKLARAAEIDRAWVAKGAAYLAYREALANLRQAKAHLETVLAGGAK